MRVIILNLGLIFFATNLSAQTVIQKQKNQKQYHAKSIKMANSRNNNLIKVQEEVISTKSTDNTKQNQVILNRNTKSSKVKMISPTTVVPNITKRKEIKPSNSKYQRKEIKTKKVKDE